MHPPSGNTVLADEFRDCINLLNVHDVAFVLVGGYALGWHGVVRATGDIDFFYEQSATNVERLCTALREFGAPERLVDRDFLLSPNAVTQIGLPPLRIDLLASLTGVTFEQVRSGAIEAELEGQRLLIIGLDQLRINKGATGRTKDKSDLRRLGEVSMNPPRRGG